MKKSKLTDRQKEALSKMANGMWRSAYGLQISRNTLEALVRKGLVESRSSVGAIFSPSTNIQYRLKIK